MATHRRPLTLLFVPYLTEARVCVAPYQNDSEPHLDTTAVIYEVGGVVIYPETPVGSPAESFTIPGLALTVGAIYAVRVRYVSASGSSGLSNAFNARVAAADPIFDAIPVPSPSTDAVRLSVLPDYAIAKRPTTALAKQETESRAHIRRITSETDTNRTRLVWRSLTTAQRDTLLAELRQAADEGRPFDTDGANRDLGGALWATIAGRIGSRYSGPGLWDVSVDAVEVSP